MSRTDDNPSRADDNPRPATGPTASARVTVGQLLHLGEADYRYGTGPLTLRVTQVGDAQQLSGEPWVSVRGVPVLDDGREGRERYALVRVAALPAPRPGVRRPASCPATGPEAGR